MTEHKIATFGCWNRNVEEDGILPMRMVTDYLKNVESNYSDLIILGDNYYANKQKITDPNTGLTIKKTDFIQKDFELGFDMIENINIKNKFLIMGNHDIEDTLLTNCQGLTLQKAKINKFNVMFPFGSHIVDVEGTKYKYIFIDTTLYKLKDRDNNCFNMVERKHADEIICEQTRFLNRELSDPTIKIFLVFGHEPLISLKSKEKDDEKEEDKKDKKDKKPEKSAEKKEPKLKKKFGLLNEDLMNLLFNSNKDILYVCADVHMYQNGIVTNSKGQQIKQIVCGTGGGEKDHYLLQNEPLVIGNYTLNLTSYHDAYGYIEIILRPQEIYYHYININKGRTNVYRRKYFIDYR